MASDARKARRLVDSLISEAESILPIIAQSESGLTADLTTRGYVLRALLTMYKEGKTPRDFLDRATAHLYKVL